MTHVRSGAGPFAAIAVDVDVDVDGVYDRVALPSLSADLRRVMLTLVRDHDRSQAALPRAARRGRSRRPGLILLNTAGWSALIALGSIVSVLGALRLPLPAALLLGLAVSSSAYTAEWLMTRRGLRRSRGGGRRPPGGGPAGVREPRPPGSPLPTLSAHRQTPH